MRPPHTSAFRSVCSSVDFYTRAVRAERMVRALMPHNALIVGDWAYLDRTGSHARFVTPVAATVLDELYADSRIVANTLPSVRYGSHERIMAGLLAKCAVVSESTPWLDRAMDRCPSFFGLKDGLSDTIHSILIDSAIEEKIEASVTAAHEMFSMEKFITELLSYVELERYRKADLGWWTFPPRAWRTRAAFRIARRVPSVTSPYTTCEAQACRCLSGGVFVGVPDSPAAGTPISSASSRTALP
ncbi:MAG TPA: hypothetical protein VHC72_13415 [Bryobacteraceae bacterium]|nr:hypothetical protein [Bryobacteraceae bacterium]